MNATDGARDADGTRVRQLLDVVRDVAAEVAPHELPLLSGLQGFGHAEIGRRLTHRGRRDDPLGFGLGEAVVLVSPIVWLVVQQVADRIAESAVDGVRSRGSAVWRRWRRRPEPAPGLPEFSAEALREVRAGVVEKATQAGMAEAPAQQLADSVVDHLVRGTADEAEDESEA
ncbi:hypothetical protein [Yinghuangia seranimata]|uniref:hypothetical protein n=1 Tax=Yinghuangia seranimata TaxID=408067 RepID=UPI00248ACA12|nr:hypothetical protein [Yinghuangia seranimata]MDI2125022.1 hypothetical protein [Yinghuangia seranimata]